MNIDSVLLGIMVKVQDQFKKDIIEFRNNVKRFRDKVIEEIVDKDDDRVDDTDILKLAKQEYNELDKFLDKFHDKLLINIYKSQESVHFELEEIISDLKKMRQEIKEQRKSLEGKNVRETTKNVVDYLEKKLKKMGKKLKKHLDWNSDLDLFKDLQ